MPYYSNSDSLLTNEYAQKLFMLAQLLANAMGMGMPVVLCIARWDGLTSVCAPNEITKEMAQRLMDDAIMYFKKHDITINEHLSSCN